MLHVLTNHSVFGLAFKFTLWAHVDCFDEFQAPLHPAARFAHTSRSLFRSILCLQYKIRIPQATNPVKQWQQDFGLVRFLAAFSTATWPCLPKGRLQTILGTDNTLSIARPPPPPPLPITSHNEISSKPRWNDNYNIWSRGLFKHRGQLKSKSAVHTYPSDLCKCSPPPHVQQCKQGSLQATFSCDLLLEVPGIN